MYYKVCYVQVALINVVHIKDSVCTLPTSVLAQYLKQANGQLSCLKVGNLLVSCTPNCHVHIDNSHKLVSVPYKQEPKFKICKLEFSICHFKFNSYVVQGNSRVSGLIGTKPDTVVGFSPTKGHL